MGTIKFENAENITIKFANDKIINNGFIDGDKFAKDISNQIIIDYINENEFFNVFNEEFKKEFIKRNYYELEQFIIYLLNMKYNKLVVDGYKRYFYHKDLYFETFDDLKKALKK